MRITPNVLLVRETFGRAFPVLSPLTMNPGANWVPFLDPIKKEEISIDFGTVKSDKSTGEAIERRRG